MKYLLLLGLLFAIAVLGAFINGQSETPTENQDNVKTFPRTQAIA